MKLPVPLNGWVLTSRFLPLVLVVCFRETSPGDRSLTLEGSDPPLRLGPSAEVHALFFREFV